MKKIIFALCLLVSVSVSSKEKDCEEGAESLSMVEACLLTENEKPVNDAYDKLVKSMTNQESIGALKQSQDDWIKFRNSTCNYLAISKSENGNSDRTAINVDCQTDFNKARVKILNGYAKSAKANK